MQEFKAYLIQEEKSELTVAKYLRDVARFLQWLGGGELSKVAVLAYKEKLLDSYAVASVNSCLSAINTYLAFINRSDCRVKVIRQQRRAFLPENKELSKAEYQRLVRAAEGKPRLCLLMQTICATGIRVSEHRFITVEAARTGQAEVSMKGKHRVVFIEKALRKALLRYAKDHGIKSGSIFITATGRPVDRSNIWAEMKKLCDTARVSREKVFPHNLRHLFARLFYGMERDIVRLADILGHANVNTTRIYTMESGNTHRRQMEKMKLVFIT